MRGHHPQLEPGPGLAGSLRDGPQRAPGRLGRVGLDDGRVQARKIAPLRVELGGQVDGRRGPVEVAAGDLLAHDLGHALLVLAVAVAEQERDHDALHPRVQEPGRGLAGVLLAQGQHLLAEDVDAPAHSEHALAGDEGLVVMVGDQVQAVGVRVAEVGLDAALHLEHVLVPGGHDRAHAPALPAEEPVEHRRAREDPARDRRERLRGRAVPLAQRVLGGVHEPLRLVFGGGLRLAHDEVAGLVHDEGVGHRAARVYGQDLRPVLGRNGAQSPAFLSGVAPAGVRASDIGPTVLRGSRPCAPLGVRV